MDYYKILNLNKEPFSTSPDPDFFFRSGQYMACLHRLEIAIRLKRGLSLVVGDVGTGKTTICRQMICELEKDDAMETHLILDPSFDSPEEALCVLKNMLGESSGKDLIADGNIKEILKKIIFTKAIDQNKIIVLLIDEGQKIPGFFIEILRELLNYESNEHKLIQIIIFAQKEIKETLNNHSNFMDRISLFFSLGPLGFNDVRKLIAFRLKKAGYDGRLRDYFSFPALFRIYYATSGYPRKIIHICHQCMLMMIIQNRPRVVWPVVGGALKFSQYKTYGIRPKKPVYTLLMLIFLAISGIMISQKFMPYMSWTDIGLNRFYEKSRQEVDNHKKRVKNKKDDRIAHNKDIAHMENGYPEILGKISVKPGETLGELVKIIYGTVTPGLLKAVTQANPHIKTPHRISVNQDIVFPAVMINSDKKPANGYLIEVARALSLNNAIELYRLYSKKIHIPLYLISWWTPLGKMNFSLCVKECYLSQKEACERAEQLKTLFPMHKLDVIGQWQKNTVFFSKLFMPGTGNKIQEGSEHEKKIR